MWQDELKANYVFLITIIHNGKCYGVDYQGGVIAFAERVLGVGVGLVLVL